jgi:acetyl esterase/lipase
MRLLSRTQLLAAFASFLLVLTTLRSTTAFAYDIRTGIPYAEGKRHTLNLYTPTKPLPGAPLIVFFYGGSWDSGRKETYFFVGQALAAAGVTVVLPDYRVYPDTAFPGFVEDGAAAVAWAWSNIATAGGERRPLFLAGHSAGAQIAMLLGLDERYLAAAGLPDDAVSGIIGLSGPYDFLPLKQDRFKPIFPEETRADSQPIRFVDGKEPPVLLLTGGDDDTVNIGNTTRLAEEIAGRGGTVTVKVYPGAGHMATVLALATALPFRKPPVRADIVAFIASLTE